MIELNDLPNELLINIFNNLSIKELHKCRLVCKYFNESIKKVELLNLEINGNRLKDKFNYLKDKLLMIELDNGYTNRIKINNELTSFSSMNTINLNYLEKLFINIIIDCDVFDLNFLNKFKVLLLLQLKGIDCKGKSRELSLPTIRFLTFNSIKHCYKDLTINCPKIIKIFCIEANHLITSNQSPIILKNELPTNSENYLIRPIIRKMIYYFLLLIHIFDSIINSKWGLLFLLPIHLILIDSSRYSSIFLIFRNFIAIKYFDIIKIEFLSRNNQYKSNYSVLRDSFSTFLIEFIAKFFFGFNLKSYLKKIYGFEDEEETFGKYDLLNESDLIK